MVLSNKTIPLQKVRKALFLFQYTKYSWLFINFVIKKPFPFENSIISMEMNYICTVTLQDHLMSSYQHSGLIIESELVALGTIFIPS